MSLNQAQAPKTRLPKSSLYVGTYSASGPRPYNEDNIDVRRTDKRLIALVADGMGGGEVGASVSSQAIKFAAESLQEQRDDGNIGAQIKQAFLLAHQSARNFRLMGDRYTKSGSTLVCVVLQATSLAMQAHVGNIGDSRVYLVRNKQVRQLTTDHNVYEQMIAEGVAPEVARADINARKLTYCLGTSNEISDAPNLYMDYVLSSGDALLLCSDGVGEFVTHSDIASILGGNPPELAAQKIVERALQNQGNDNASAIVINYGRRRGGWLTTPLIATFALILAVMVGLGLWLTRESSAESATNLLDATVTPVPTELQEQATSTALALATSTFAPLSQEEQATLTAMPVVPTNIANPANSTRSTSRPTPLSPVNAATPVPNPNPPTAVPPTAIAPVDNAQPTVPVVIQPTQAPNPPTTAPVDEPEPDEPPPPPATKAPPTAVPPPTAEPPTAVPPTAVPPTAVPPTAVPPPTAEPPTPTPRCVLIVVCEP